MRTPIVIGALLVTAGVSFLAGRLLSPNEAEEVHHFYLPVPIPKGEIGEDLEQALRFRMSERSSQSPGQSWDYPMRGTPLSELQKLRDLMNRPTPRPAAPPESPAPAAPR